MTAKKIALFLFAFSLLLTTLCSAQNRFRASPTGERKSFDHAGTERAYRIHVPKSYDGSRKVPLVLMLHGGGGNADVGSRMGMTPVADKHGFIAVYPEGINKHWNDGRESEIYREQDAKIDDVAFIRALVASLKEEYKINDGKVFVCGPSNGGFMSQRLAIEMSDVFSAAGIIISSMGEPLKKNFKPEQPVSMIFMNGTDDPLVPYDGGKVVVDLTPRLNRKLPGRGTCISTDDAISLWLKKNKLEKKQPKTAALPDTDKSDECTVERKIWTGGDQGTAVALYRVVGGGHTIPGGPQYLPKRLVGNTCGDFNGVEAIWEFFDKHGRKHN